MVYLAHDLKHDRDVALGAMGELDEAFQLFDRAMEQRSGLLAFLRVTHETASPALASDPRFITLLQKMRLDF